MLAQEMIFALLQGLPAEHLDHLDRACYLLAARIQRAIKEGKDPIAALHAALINSTQWERDAYIRAFLHEEAVMALTDLTPRQKDALMALRYAGTSSVQQLSRILLLDRSYTRRLLDTLVEKGYAIKYFRRDGTYYMAIISRLSDQTRTQLVELIQSFKQALFERHGIVSAESHESSESRESRESNEVPLVPRSPASPRSPSSPPSPPSPTSPTCPPSPSCPTSLLRLLGPRTVPTLTLTVPLTLLSLPPP